HPYIQCSMCSCRFPRVPRGRIHLLHLFQDSSDILHFEVSIVFTFVCQVTGTQFLYKFNVVAAVLQRLSDFCFGRRFKVAGRCILADDSVIQLFLEKYFINCHLLLAPLYICIVLFKMTGLIPAIKKCVLLWTAQGRGLICPSSYIRCSITLFYRECV